MHAVCLWCKSRNTVIWANVAFVDSVLKSIRNIWVLSLPEILLYLFRNFAFPTVTLSCNSVIIV